MRRTRGAALGALLSAGVWLAPPGLPALAAVAAGAAPTAPASSTGLTVSWLPTTSPVRALPGSRAAGTFWVTNQSGSAMEVTVSPATALARNDGALTILAGPDRRFPSVVYTPDRFVVAGKATVPVTVLVTLPAHPGPGVYLVPAIVRPEAAGRGNIAVQTAIDPLVTFFVPGAARTKVEPSFVQAPAGTGVPETFHVPGLPLLELGSSGVQVFRVADTGRSAFYASAEVVSSQSPFGSAHFAQHTAGDPTDRRIETALYFPGRYRDTRIAWNPEPAGFGVARLSGYVSLAQRGGLIQFGATTSVLVVSAVWLFVFPAGLALAVAWLWRRVRGAVAPVHRVRSRRGRLAQVLGVGALTVVVAALSFVASPALFAGLASAGVLVGAGLLRQARARDRRTAAHRELRFVQATGATVGASALCLVLACLGQVAPSVALALSAAAGVAVVVGFLLLWWNEERRVPS